MSQPDPERTTPTPPSDTVRSIPRARMALLFAVMLTTAAGNTAMQSVMPSIGTSLGVDDVWISLAYSWSALLWVICAPIWAQRSDQRGRKAMMALGMLGFISSFVLCGVMLWLGLSGILPAFWALLLFAAARSLYGGFGSAAPPAVQAYVASRTPRAERTQALSLIASSFGLGTVIGPALAPLMVLRCRPAGPFLIFALIGLVTLVRCAGACPTTSRSSRRGSTYDALFGVRHPGCGPSGDDIPKRNPTAKLRWFEPRLRPWVVSGLLGGHAQAMVLGIAGFLVLDRLGLRDDPTAGTGPVGLVLMAGAIATLLAQWGLIPRLDLGPRAASLWGIAIAGLGTVVLGLGQNLHAIALGYSIASLGFGLFRPGNTSGTSLAVTRAEQGQAGGVTASVAGASFIYAPALGVWLYNHSDWLGFGLIVGICLVVFAYGWRTLQRDSVLTAERI